MKTLSELLTIVIPVYNEESNLPLCLDTIKDMQNILVIDSGSTDGTVAVANKYHCKVVEFKWNGEFPKKRNWVLRNCQFNTPWVLFLDADERVTPGVKQELLKVLNSTEHNCFRLIYDNWFMGKMLKHGDSMCKTAILRIGFGEYEKIEEHGWSSLPIEVHEHIIVNGTVGDIKSRMEHHDVRPLENYLAKHIEYADWESNRYLELIKKYGSIEGAKNLTDRQRTKYKLITKWWFGIAYFLACYFIKFGLLDGKAGFWFAWYKMKYFRNIRSKILQRGI